MTWSLYTQYTAVSRAFEAIIALFALFWAAWVAALIGTGLSPMSWAGFDQAGLYVGLTIATLSTQVAQSREA